MPSTPAAQPIPPAQGTHLFKLFKPDILIYITLGDQASIFYRNPILIFVSENQNIFWFSPHFQQADFSLSDSATRHCRAAN